MPEPIDGLVVIGEYGSKAEADVGVAALAQAHIDAYVAHDPAANSVATYFATDRVFEVVVREEDAEDALSILESMGRHLPREFEDSAYPSAVGARRRRRLKAVALFLIFLLIGGPGAIMLIAELLAR